MTKGTRIHVINGTHKGEIGDLVRDSKHPQKPHWHVNTREGKVIVVAVRDMDIVTANIKNTKNKEVTITA